jgi:hypothetical protein
MRHRRDRQPIATTSTTEVITCTVTGTQPCNDGGDHLHRHRHPAM